MTTTPTMTVLKCIPNLRHQDSQSSTHELNLSNLSADALATWGMEHSDDLDYRIELSRRVALEFGDADQVIMFDDFAIGAIQSGHYSMTALRGFEQALLPALWLSLGFRCGGQVLVYTPPNPIEMGEYLKLKRLIEQHLRRTISIKVLYEDASDHLLDLLTIFEENSDNYTALCETFAQRPENDYYPEYHVYMLKRHLKTITQGSHRSFVFPFLMSEFHLRELQSYSGSLILPDVPNSNKAHHNLFLRSKGFTDLPQLLAVFPDGSVVDNYEQYLKTLKHLDAAYTVKTPQNIEIFARAIIEAIDRLHQQYGVAAFVKWDSNGNAGIECMTHGEHGIIYDCERDKDERLAYLDQCMTLIILGDRLPTSAVVEEFIEAKNYPDNIIADHGICGFILGGTFFPISINLCGTEDGVYMEQWASPSPAYLHNSSADWQRMFQTYSTMTSLEAAEFSYSKGIYAGDLFVTRDGKYKQRDWNLRRGGRSPAETLTMFGMPNYFTMVTLPMTDFGLEGQLNNVEMFRVYTQTCECLVKEYGMYVTCTGFGYCGKDGPQNFFRFHVIADPKWLVDTEDSEIPSQHFPNSEHRRKMIEIVRKTVKKFLPKQ